MSIDFDNKKYLKLHLDDEYAEKVTHLLIDDEFIMGSYKSIRDGVVFTNKRIIAINVQGLTGSKKEYASLPYKNIIAFSIETAGTFDLDAELEIWFSNLGKVKFEFQEDTDIGLISKHIAKYVI